MAILAKVNGDLIIVTNVRWTEKRMYFRTPFRDENLPSLVLSRKAQGRTWELFEDTNTAILWITNKIKVESNECCKDRNDDGLRTPDSSDSGVEYFG